MTKAFHCSSGKVIWLSVLPQEDGLHDDGPGGAHPVSAADDLVRVRVWVEGEGEGEGWRTLSPCGARG